MSNRKIWAIPFAAFAMALMFAMLWLVESPTGIEAQTPATPTSAYIESMGTQYIPATGTVTVPIKNLTDLADDATPPTKNRDVITGSGVDNTSSDNAKRAYFLTGADKDKFTIGIPSGKSEQIRNIVVTAGASAVPSDTPYNVTVNVHIDNDTAVDSLSEGDDGNNDNGNDRNLTVVRNLAISVVGLDNAGSDNNRIDFHADGTKTFGGEPVSAFGRDLATKPQAIVVKGLGANTAVLTASNDRVRTFGDGDNTDTNTDGIQFFLASGSNSKIIAKKHPTTAISNASLDFSILVDTDTTKNTNTDAFTETNLSDAAKKSNDPDIRLVIDARTVSVTSLGWVGDLPTAATYPTFRYTISERQANGSAVGSFSVANAVNDTDDLTGNQPETLNGILIDSATGSRSALFSVRSASAPETGNTTMVIEYIGPDAMVPLGVHTLQLTVNGDTGLKNRTLSDGGDDDKAPLNNVVINVNPANSGHTVSVTSDEITLDENDPEVGTLAKDNTSVKDFSQFVTNPDGDKLTYSVVGAASLPFDFSGSTLMVNGAIVDTPACTKKQDGTIASCVARNPDDGGMFADRGDTNTDTETTPAADFEDVIYEFKVKISDNVTANDKEIAVTLTLNVNEAVSVMPGANVATVTDYDSTTKLYTINTTPEATLNFFNVSVLDLDNIFKDEASGNDDIKYTLVDRPAPVPTVAPGAPTPDKEPDIKPDTALQVADNMLQLSRVPEPAQGEDTLTYTFKVRASDKFAQMTGYSDATSSTAKINTEPDATAIITLTVKVVLPASGYLNFTASEDATAGSVIGSVASVLPGDDQSDAIRYVVASQNNNGTLTDPNYALNGDTGAVTVAKPRDFETASSALTIMTVRVMKGTADIGTVTVAITTTDANEAPTFGAAPSLSISEKAQVGTNVGAPIAASDVDAGDTISYSIKETDVPFSVMKTDTGGQIQVAGALSLADSPYSVTLVATDNGGMAAELALSIKVGDENDAPMFDTPYMTEFTVNEQDSAAAEDLATYNATDVDGTDALQGVKFVLTDSDDARHFVMTNQTNDTTGEHEGVLSVKAGANLDVDAAGTKSEYELLLAVCDKLNACSEKIDITVTITPQNDNAPMFRASALPNQPVAENAARGTALGGVGAYMATDADGDTITYSLEGPDSKSFSIDGNGTLMTLEALDADPRGSSPAVPCGAAGCNITVVANDGEKTAKQPVKITVGNVDDSVSNFTVKKANPVANISSDGDDAMSALADGKTTMSKVVPESPSDLPAMSGTALDTFVTADWANWGTVLRIEVTAQSPAANCGNGNQCVYVDVEGKDSDDKLMLTAYRSSEMDNKFVTAVKVVKKGQGTDDTDPNDDDKTVPVYMHNGGGVAQLEAEEEDEIEIRLSGSKIAPRTVEVENEAPEFGNFMPEHEAAYDDGDVDYTFTITDSVSGIPEPEDLPDNDGNSDYMPLVALVSGSQCHTADPNDKKKYTMYDFAGNSVWCMSKPEIRAVTDDRDFDEIDDGFEVETTIVLDANENHWVTFVVCDAAGNCELYTPDENKTDEALPLITIDTEDPVLVEARTGIMWDETDEELDMNNSTWIQVIFEDLSPLNDGTVEADDFVVQGHTVKEAKRYEDDADEGNRRMVFLELEDELAPDEEPEVTLVPNGVADIAGNDQDEGEVDAKDYIAPSFTVVSMVSPGTPDGSSNVLAGDGDEVVISITSDERIRKTQPDVTITHVNAPAGCVETSVDRSKLTAKGDGSTYARGEIILAGDKEGCDSASAMGGTLGKTFEKVSNTEWTLTVKEPAATGYYNIFIEAADRSAQDNMGSEGVAPADIATDFFERDGDVNSGDAHYFQGDINLPNPGVWVSGQRIEDTEPAVEFKTPLFVELDFTKKYIDDCAKNIDDDERNANCYAESDEYAKDSFDSVKVTSFTLNGTDITDSVKTTDNETFLVSIDGIGIGDHKIEVQALDEAGNDFDDTLTIEFEVEERDAFSKRLSPGWNLVSLPGEPADSSIGVVFGSDIEVRTVYTYDPIMPGGWMVAVRESVDSDWQGDLTEITARRGYWVLSDAIQDWDVSIPRLAGGAVGSGTPIQPPVIALYAGWNLVPVIDVTGDFAGSGISAKAYLQSLDDGLDLARVLGFDTITNSWSTVMAPETGTADTLEYGKAYWVFVRQAASLVPGN